MWNMNKFRRCNTCYSSNSIWVDLLHISKTTHSSLSAQIESSGKIKNVFFSFLYCFFFFFCCAAEICHFIIYLLTFSPRWHLKSRSAPDSLWQRTAAPLKPAGLNVSDQTPWRHSRYFRLKLLHMGYPSLSKWTCVF